MAKVTKATDQLHRSLIKAGIANLSAGQLQGAVEDQLGPLDTDSKPLAHWAALAKLVEGRERRPEADDAAMALAVAGHACVRLPEALRRFRTGPDGAPGEDPEKTAEHVVQVSGTIGGADTFGAGFVRRFRRGSQRSGAPWPAASHQEESLQHLGRLQAVLTGIAEVLAGSPASTSIDADDVSAVLGGAIDAQTIDFACQLMDRLRVLAPDAADQLVADAQPWALAAAVHAAEGLLPLWEALVMPVDTELGRWQTVAALTPLMLSLGGLLPSDTAQLGALFNRPDIAEHYRDADPYRSTPEVEPSIKEESDSPGNPMPDEGEA